MLAYLDVNDEPQVWSGEPIDGVYFPRDVESKWTLDELTDAGLYPIIPFQGVPYRTAVGEPWYRLSGRVRGWDTVVFQEYDTIDAI
jgi:hypothetical protein